MGSIRLLGPAGRKTAQFPNCRAQTFEPGNTMGRGRPKGSRNKSKSPGQDLFDEYAEHLIRKGIALALALASVK